MSRSRQVRPADHTPDSQVQQKADAATGGSFADRPKVSASGFNVQANLMSPRAQVQFKGQGAGDVIGTAKTAFSGGGSSMPHQQKVESSFGTDMSSVQAYTGPAASKACESLGAQAFTMGNKIAFKEASPSVGLVAHEAAHVVQQSQGVQLSGGVGKPGDSYEKHADAVAAKTTAGQSAAPLLQKKADGAGSSAVQASQVQMLGHELGEDRPAGSADPAHLEQNDQRQYSVEQYVEMWEAERGRKMTAGEQKTLARGCIGIVALNLTGGGNPPLDHSFATFDQAKKLVDEWNAFIQKHKGETTSDGKKIGDMKAVLFAKLFWSNQSPVEEERKKGDDSAYLPDEDGKVDMSDYKYRSQPGYINFDYGFWDEGSQSFWHANHCQPGMKVYQSTKDKFSAGYMDFDRIIFCAAIVKNYKAAASAAAY